MSKSKKYQVMDGGDIQAIAVKIMQHERGGWILEQVLSQPLLIESKEGIIVSGRPPSTPHVVEAFYPLMYKIIDSNGSLIC